MFPPLDIEKELPTFETRFFFWLESREKAPRIQVKIPSPIPRLLQVHVQKGEVFFLLKFIFCFLSEGARPGIRSERVEKGAPIHLENFHLPKKFKPLSTKTMTGRVRTNSNLPCVRMLHGNPLRGQTWKKRNPRSIHSAQAVFYLSNFQCSWPKLFTFWNLSQCHGLVRALHLKKLLPHFPKRQMSFSYTQLKLHMVVYPHLLNQLVLPKWSIFSRGR